MSLNGVIIGFLPLYQPLKLTNRFIPARDISSFAGVLCIVCVFCDLILKPVFYAQNHAFLSVYVYTTTRRRSRQALFVTLWAVSCKMFPRGLIMQIKYSKQAYKYLTKLHKPKRDKLISAINQIPEGDIVKMRGIDNLYRLRVNDYRVLFTPEYDIIKINKIGSRGDIYK